MRIWDDTIGRDEQAAYEKAGKRAPIGFGQMPALIIVDMYKAFVDVAYPQAPPNASAMVPNIKRLLDEFRAQGLPVFFTTAAWQPTAASRGRWKVHSTGVGRLMQDPDAYEICPELKPQDDEYVFVKSYPSAFFGTTLVSQLIYHRVDTIIVTGTVTSGCVRGTCLDGFNLNYRVIVPEECVCDRGLVSHKVALFEIHTKYGDVVEAADVTRYLSEGPFKDVTGRRDAGTGTDKGGHNAGH